METETEPGQVAMFIGRTPLEELSVLRYII